ncbi:MAG: acetyl-CoA carboxylase biotin carboxyl carrier protein [Sphingomicrobium sp.]
MAEDKSKGVAEGAMRIDAALVRELAELLSANELTEIEVEDGVRKIRVRREVAVQMVHAAPPMAASAPVATAAPPPEAPPAVPAMPAGEAVKSPMVGTAFLSAEPGGKPFVAAGDAVKVGDTLLIIEAMKVMNPILATKAGTVRQLLVADAQPVEYDQPLVIVE